MPQPIKASDVHLNADIRLAMLALLATQRSTRRMFQETPETDAYAAGFQEALFLLAGALNINLGIPTARDYVDSW